MSELVGNFLGRMGEWVAGAVIVSAIAGALFGVIWGIYAVAFGDESPWFLLVIAFGVFWLWKLALPAIWVGLTRN